VLKLVAQIIFLSQPTVFKEMFRITRGQPAATMDLNTAKPAGPIMQEEYDEKL
jgi:hypothetical protein